MKSLPSLSLCILFFIARGLQAQEATPKATPPPLPPSPLIKRAPEFSQWAVTFKATMEKTKSGEKPAADQRNMQTVIAKTKSIYHLQSVNGLGVRTEKWVLGDLQVSIVPNAQYPILSTGAGAGEAYFTDYSKSDFTGFQWISSKNYTGVEKVQGNDCYIFKDRIKAETKEMVDAVAAIDVKTQLPLSLQMGESLTTYQYGQAPSAVLVPPASVQTLADSWRQRMKQAASMPPP